MAKQRQKQTGKSVLTRVFCSTVAVLSCLNSKCTVVFCVHLSSKAPLPVPFIRMNLKITVFVKLPFGLWLALWAGGFSPVSGPMGLYMKPGQLDWGGT